MSIEDCSVIKTRYEGRLGEVLVYHMAIFDSSEIVKTFISSEKEIVSSLAINLFETDNACSWCICECVSRAFPELIITGHSLNDLYEAIYDSFFTGMEFSLRGKLLPYLQTKNPIKVLKVLPMQDRTIIAIGT